MNPENPKKPRKPKKKDRKYTMTKRGLERTNKP